MRFRFIYIILLSIQFIYSDEISGNISGVWNTEGSPYLVTGNLVLLPADHSISAAYPNPFNPTTNISYSLEEYGKVMISVYDIKGRKVATLIDKYQDLGSYEITWDASMFSSGVYLLQMTCENFVSTQKLMLIK